MREILFRGKRVDGTIEWVYGGYAEWGLVQSVITTKGKYGENNAYEVDPDTVGQWTGLVDKNGVKVFEGDVVKADDVQAVVRFGRCGGVENVKHAVGYIGFYLDFIDEKLKRYGLRDDIVYWHEEYGLEVIGNIHDNPDLMAD